MKKLTIGMRCRIKPESSWGKDWEYGDKEVLLKERSRGSFSVMVLGQSELKKKDQKTVENEIAWVDEDELVFVDDNFKENLDFMDWYQEHEDDFCGDCGVWFPNCGAIDPKTDEDYRCPNEQCPGNKHADGLCPFCEPDVKLNDDDACPECGWKEMY